MRGKVRCEACGYKFEIGEANFNFDLSGKAKSEMRCPRCKSDNIVPLYGK
jgi:DNA-directed RNA polymerase subunit RPC12/RpoP